MNKDAEHQANARSACRDGTTRKVAFALIVVVLPTLLAGASLWQALRGEAVEIQRPLAQIAAPLVEAYRADRDLPMLGYLALQLALLAIVTSLPAAALHRRMAVEIATGVRETPEGAWRFARHHASAVAGATFLCRLVFLLPLGLLAIVAAIGGGWVPVVVCLALLGILIVVRVLLGLHPVSAVAVDGLGMWKAWGRTLALVGASPGRTLATRFSGSAFLLPGALMRLVVLGGLGALAFRLLDRAHPLLVVLLLLFAVFWLADLVCRLAAARTLRYLRLRETALGTAPSVLGCPAEQCPPQSAEDAGFVEVGRVV